MKTSKFNKTGAKNEVRNMNNSPLFWLHAYNKACKKNTAIDGLQGVNLLPYFKACNKITDGRGFTFAVLPKNSNGEICKIIKASAKTYRGGEFITTFAGIFELQPISTTCYKTSLIDAIDSYLKYREMCEKDLQATFGAHAINENGHIIPAKIYTKFEVAKMYADGQITEVQFNEMLKTAA